MAQLVVVPVNSTTISWYITGLSNPFSTDYYIRVTLSTNPAINGSATPPTVLLSSINAIPSYGSTTTPSVTTTGGSAFSGGNTYTLYGTAQSINGLYYTAGSATFTMPVPRPSNFNWTYAGINPTTMTITTGSDKISNYYFYVHNSEWTALQNRINQFRIYKGLSSYSFTPVSSGSFFYASLFNQCVTAILAMTPPIPPPSTVSTNQNIAASMLNGLKNSLNSIP